MGWHTRMSARRQRSVSPEDTTEGLARLFGALDTKRGRDEEAEEMRAVRNRLSAGESRATKRRERDEDEAADAKRCRSALALCSLQYSTY